MNFFLVFTVSFIFLLPSFLNCKQTLLSFRLPSFKHLQLVHVQSGQVILFLVPEFSSFTLILFSSLLLYR